MAYETYQRRPRRVGVLSVTITAARFIVPNASARAVLGLSVGGLVQVLWDRSARRIALKAVGHDPHAYVLSRNGFRAADFLEHISYDHTQGTRCFPATWDAATSLLEIQIPEPPDV